MPDHANAQQTVPTTPPPRIAVITCAVMENEIRHFTQQMGHIVHLEVMPQGLHNEPPKLRIDLQTAVDRVEQTTDAQAIVLGYGLCSRGVEGVAAKRCQLVMARAHDCITLLLGDHQRYADYVSQYPGTYWYSPGWNKHHTPPGPLRYQGLLEKYVQLYGRDNAEYLVQMEQQWMTKYDRAVWVDLGVGVDEKDVQYTRDCAKWLNWSFDAQKGDPRLLIDLLMGRWDAERFLVLEPGQACEAAPDAGVVRAVTLRGEPIR
ncbi:MAG: DUF1638 domain-containing protein [Phycisphaeraceae bacterium]|nr:DUF1638 domain-containing protein [Phycisphaeraceae bacterium]